MAVLGSTLQEARAVSFVAAVDSTPPSTAGRLTAAGSCPGPASTSWGSGLSCPQVSKVKQEGGIEGLGRMEGRAAAGPQSAETRDGAGPQGYLTHLKFIDKNSQVE